MNDLTSTEGIVALAAAAVALIALALAISLALRMRRLRADQSAVLGEGGAGDLVAHAVRLEAGFTDLRDYVEQALARFEERMDSADRRIDDCIAYRALIRYDAYGELSGKQSSSYALLDSSRSGIVVSSILHRDQARVYVKEVHGGESELELSPEERAAIEAALSAPAQA